MDDADPIADVEELPEGGTHLFAVAEADGREEETILARADDGVVAWKNFCVHEPDQRLDRGGRVGAAVRGGEVICPRHGSLFDLATGACGNGPAAGQSLVGVDVTVEDGTVYLTDDRLTYLHDGGIDDDDDEGPSSTSHRTF